MNQQQTHHTLPEMTVIATRPTNVLPHLESSTGVYVQCRLATGEDVHVPLAELFRLLGQELRREITAKTGQHG